jgi:RNA polymerase sigma-70 factor, ECF subfamily
MSDDVRQVYERLLVLRCQTGDALAFAELVGAYTGRLRYYLSQFAQREQPIDDWLQDVWFEAYRGLPRLRDPAALPAWLYRIARNRAYRELRRPQLIQQEIAQAAELASESESDTVSADDAEQLHAALAKLSPEHREVMVLRFLEGMSYEHTAAVIGCELGTVKSRIHYAKRALRQILERSMVHE